MKLKIKIKDGRVDEIERDDLKQNWIEKKGGKVPLPGWMIPLVLNYVEDEDIEESVGLEALFLSGQFWSSLRSDQKAEWIELVEWLGKDVSDYVRKMEQMYPKNPERK